MDSTKKFISIILIASKDSEVQTTIFVSQNRVTKNRLKLDNNSSAGYSLDKFFFFPIVWRTIEFPGARKSFQKWKLPLVFSFAEKGVSYLHTRLSSLRASWKHRKVVVPLPVRVSGESFESLGLPCSP